MSAHKWCLEGGSISYTIQSAIFQRAFNTGNLFEAFDQTMPVETPLPVRCCAIGGEWYQGSDFISSVLHENDTCGWLLVTLQSCFTPEKHEPFVSETSWPA